MSLAFLEEGKGLQDTWTELEDVGEDVQRGTSPAGTSHVLDTSSSSSMAEVHSSDPKKH